MTAEVDVYNMALMRIGVYDSRVSDPSEKTTEAGVCKFWFPIVRDYVLRDYPCNFAEKRASLAKVGDGPTNWTYAYSLPADCVMVKGLVYPGSRNPRADQRIPFQLGQSEAYGKLLYTDMDEAELVYTAKVTDLTQWDSISISGLAYRLAAEIAQPLSKKPDVAQAAMQGYSREMANAGAHMANERGADPEPDPESLTARGVGRTQQSYYRQGV